MKIVPCKWCQASIIWTLTKNDKRMPVDARPVKRVVIERIPVQDRQVGEVIRSQVVDTYMPHHATCPHTSKGAATFRGGPQ